MKSEQIKSTIKNKPICQSIKLPIDYVASKIGDRYFLSKQEYTSKGIVKEINIMSKCIEIIPHDEEPFYVERFILLTKANQLSELLGDEVYSINSDDSIKFISLRTNAGIGIFTEEDLDSDFQGTITSLRVRDDLSIDITFDNNVCINGYITKYI